MNVSASVSPSINGSVSVSVSVTSNVSGTDNASIGVSLDWCIRVCRSANVRMGASVKVKVSMSVGDL